MTPIWTNQSRTSYNSEAQYSGLETAIRNETAVVLGGQILFDTTSSNASDSAGTYRILDGEVLILRNGQMIDLVQAGELLDPQIWQDAIAVAMTDCALEKIPTNVAATEKSGSGFFQYTPPAVLDQQLYRAATATN